MFKKVQIKKTFTDSQFLSVYYAHGVYTATVSKSRLSCPIEQSIEVLKQWHPMLATSNNYRYIRSEDVIIVIDFDDFSLGTFISDYCKMHDGSTGFSVSTLNVKRPYVFDYTENHRFEPNDSSDATKVYVHLTSKPIDYTRFTVAYDCTARTLELSICGGIIITCQK